MVIGWVHRDQQGASAWAQVEAAQRDVRLPCLLVPQPAHAVLAGELAAALLPTAFGELPPEIQRAIQMHDTGWAASDAQQIQRLRSGAGPRRLLFPLSPSRLRKPPRRGPHRSMRSKPSPSREQSSSAATSVCSPNTISRTISVFFRPRSHASESSKAHAEGRTAEGRD